MFSNLKDMFVATTSVMTTNVVTETSHPSTQAIVAPKKVFILKVV